MDVTEALLESWDRQCRIVNAVAARVDDANKNAKPSEDGWALGHHLAHMHKVRHYFLEQVAPERSAGLTDTFVDGWETPIQDLFVIKASLVHSGRVVRETVRDSLSAGTQLKRYDHPVLFLQHMVWHEGYHFSLIVLAIRNVGVGPEGDWYEGIWRS